MNCPVCFGTKVCPYRQYGIADDTSGEFYELWKCKSCALVFTVPQPTQEFLTKLYSDDQYYSYQKVLIPSVTIGGGWIARLKKWAKERVLDHYYGYGWRQDGFRSGAISQAMGFIMRRWPKEDVIALRRILPYVKGGKHLDIGCGSGRYVHWMRQHGWDSQGIEISATAVKNAREAGLSVRQTTLLEAGFPANQFDLITAWEVLEHLPRLSDNLSEISRILKEGGKFVGSVPNIESWEAELFGRKWQGLEIPYHLYHFSPKSLKCVLEEARLQLYKLEFLPVTHSFEASLDKVGILEGFKKKALMALGRPLYAATNFFGKGARMRFEAMPM